MKKLIVSGLIVIFGAVFAVANAATPVTTGTTSTAPEIHKVGEKKEVKKESLKKEAKETNEKLIVGTASSISGGTIVVTDAKNKAYTVSVAPAGKVVNRVWKKIDLSTIQNGDKVRILGTVNGTAVTASTVRDITLPKVSETKKPEAKKPEGKKAEVKGKVEAKKATSTPATKQQ